MNEVSTTSANLFVAQFTKQQKRDTHRLITLLFVNVFAATQAHTKAAKAMKKPRSALQLMNRKSMLENLGKNLNLPPLEYIYLIFQSSVLSSFMPDILQQKDVSSRFIKELHKSTNAHYPTPEEGEEVQKRFPSFLEQLGLENSIGEVIEKEGALIVPWENILSEKSKKPPQRDEKNIQEFVEASAIPKDQQGEVKQWIHSQEWKLVGDHIAKLVAQNARLSEEKKR